MMFRYLLVFSLLTYSANADLCPTFLVKIGKTLTTWSVPKDIKNFNPAEYEKSLEFYSKKRKRILNESDRPVTIEQKLAFFDAFRPEEMRLSLDSMTKVQKKELSKILKNVDFQAGMSKEKLAEFFVETYLLSHPTSDSLIQRWRLGSDEFIRNLVKQRFIEEFSQQGLFESAKKFGIILPETRKEKVFNIISSYFSKETKIPGYLINKILKEGFTEKNYAAFEKLFGKSVKTSSLWNHLKRSLGWGLFGFFCYQDIREQDDENQKEANKITEHIEESTEEVKALTKEILEALPDDVNIKEHLLAEWLKDYIDAHGLPPQVGSPDYEEYEELKKMLSKENPALHHGN